MLRQEKAALARTAWHGPAPAKFFSRCRVTRQPCFWFLRGVDDWRRKAPAGLPGGLRREIR